MTLPRRIARDLAAPPAGRLVEAARGLGRPLWLVGGRLRDELLGLPGKPELDLAAEDPRTLLAPFRRAPGEAVVEIDRERDTFRVVAAPGSAISHVDVARLRAPTIAGDLALRDFTANALAIEVSGGDARLLDPTGGAADLRRRILRACGPRSVADDPLRALRGVRLAANLGLRIEPATLRMLAAGGRGLARVSAERIRDELFAILRGPRPAAGIGLALRLGLLRRAGLAARAGGGLSRLRRTERVLAELPARSALRRALAEPLEQGVDRRAVALLAALLRDLGLGARAEAVAARAALGTRATRALVAASRARFPRAWCRDPRRAGRAGLLALHEAAGGAWAETLAAHSPSAPEARALARALLAARRRFARPPLLDGATAMRELGLPPGPALGRLLAAVRRAQDLGAVRTRAGALRWACRALAARPFA